MNDWLSSFVIFAEEPAKQQGGSLFQTVIMFAPLLLLWLFMIEGPRRKQARMREQTLKSLKKNDHVITASGIFGVITNVLPESGEVTIRVDDTTNTRIRVLLSSIERVIAEDTETSSESKDKQD